MIDLNHLAERYKNHVALFKDYDSIKILDFAEPGTSMKSIRFIFNEDNYELIISGDLGHLIARNDSNMVYSKFRSDFTNSPGYFAGKVKYCEYPIYEYNKEAAEADLKYYLIQKGYAEEDEPKLFDTIDNTLCDFDTDPGITDRGYNVLNDIDNCAFEYATKIGRVSSGQLEFYLALFKLAQSKLPDAKP